MKKDLSTKLLIIIFIIGLSLLLYPSVSNYWNSFTQTQAVATYEKEVSNLDNKTYKKIFNDAKHYNKTLRTNGNRFLPTEEEHKKYMKLLDVSGTGMMGYVEIKSIRCNIPIYHGTDDSVLQVGAGHIEGSSLPVGGKSTHSVLSGHRGLPSAKLFSDLDQLVEGDTFVIHVLDKILTYEVDQILTVEPEEVESLEIIPGQDYCTLVTCTPYGVNSHRLLVRGHRIENEFDDSRVTADAIQIDPELVAPFVAIPMITVLFIGVLIKTRKRR